MSSPMSSLVDGSQVRCPKMCAPIREGHRISWAKLTDCTGFYGNYWPEALGPRNHPTREKPRDRWGFSAQKGNHPRSRIPRAIKTSSGIPVLARKLQYTAAAVLAGSGRKTVFLRETFWPESFRGRNGTGEDGDRLKALRQSERTTRPPHNQEKG